MKIEIAPAMQITNMAFAATGIITLTIINHNLTQNPTSNLDTDYILLENIVADATTMLVLNGSIIGVYQVIDANTITINTSGLLVAGMYFGGGTVTRVSNIQINTKWINPYLNKDKNVYVHKVDFAVLKTTNGQITVDYYPSSTTLSMLDEGSATGALIGTGILETFPYGVLYPLELAQDMLWHPVYFQTSGESIQLALYFSENQIVQPAVALAPFELEAFIIFATSTSDRLQCNLRVRVV